MQMSSVHPYLQRLKGADFVKHVGYVTRVLPGFIEASGPNVAIGTVCQVLTDGGEILSAESVSASSSTIVLMPYATTEGVRVGDKVEAEVRNSSVKVGADFLGRAVDGLGRPLDGGRPLVGSSTRNLHGQVAKPLDRGVTKNVVETGIKSIDTLLTLGEGQRIGVFAGSGVGKTTLLNAIARNVKADVKVICLVGERGRETEEFWRTNISEADRVRTVLVASTSDQPAVLRVRAVYFALALAEFFRDQSMHVLFVMDSITRYAMAMREIGLAVGEPPTTRAYTPSVFAALPKVVERCGMHLGGGAITAIFSVLAESDDIEDPLSDIMRSLLDGHILLSRDLAEQGRYPAIDVPRSISRLMHLLCRPDEIRIVQATIAALSQYEKSRILIETGAYKAGNSAEIDHAIKVHSELNAYLAQDLSQIFSRKKSMQDLARILGAQLAH